MSTAVDSVILRFKQNGNSEILELPGTFTEYRHMRLMYLSYCVNFKNVMSIFQNNRLYLNTLGSVFIDLPDGIYDINDLNNWQLWGAISGWFYKI